MKKLSQFLLLLLPMAVFAQDEERGSSVLKSNSTEPSREKVGVSVENSQKPRCPKAAAKLKAYAKQAAKTAKTNEAETSSSVESTTKYLCCELAASSGVCCKAATNSGVCCSRAANARVCCKKATSLKGAEGTSTTALDEVPLGIIICRRPGEYTQEAEASASTKEAEELPEERCGTKTPRKLQTDKNLHQLQETKDHRLQISEHPRRSKADKDLR